MKRCIIEEGKLYAVFNHTDYTEMMCQRHPKDSWSYRYLSKVINAKTLEEDFSFKCEIGKVDKDFVELDKQVFDLENKFRIHSSLVRELRKRHFYKYPFKGSIMKKIDYILNDDFYLVPNDYCNVDINYISFDEYEELVKSFPTITTFQHFVNMDIAGKIEAFFGVKKDYGQTFKNHIEKKEVTRPNRTFINEELDARIVSNEIEKFNAAIKKLEYLLSVDRVHEMQWQKEILDIILLVYPQYQFAIDAVSLDNAKQVDFVLIDLFNNVDIIEIKRPDKAILRKALYRDNYVPSHELTGASIQVEFYIRQLMGNPTKNVTKIKKKLERKGFSEEIQINNVKGMIIIGRTNGFNDKQKESYRIIKNQFSNIVSLISYDELLSILSRIRDRFSTDGLDKIISEDTN